MIANKLFYIYNMNRQDSAVILLLMLHIWEER